METIRFLMGTGSGSCRWGDCDVTIVANDEILIVEKERCDPCFTDVVSSVHDEHDTESRPSLSGVPMNIDQAVDITNKVCVLYFRMKKKTQKNTRSF